MPFIPHTQDEVNAMLDTIKVDRIDDLFDEIPQDLLTTTLKHVPEGVNEQQITRIMKAREAQDREQLCFIGAGAYEHHIPAAVWDLVGRGEFMTAYTPYQAEASQGNLQLIYEYQTMMSNLTGMDVSNASMYDGASALSEAILMAVRANRKSKSKRILILDQINPNYLEVINTIVKSQGIQVEMVDIDYAAGRSTLDAIKAYVDEDITAVVIPQPNFLGSLTEVDAFTNWAHSKNALVIALVNPTALAVIEAPGAWGGLGADIACGDGQPMGIPLASGGPYFGFLTCKQAIVRQMPGRIVGRTVDQEGKQGFCLTLQAREQHIRRSKATSNICTNQGLLVTAATIYMSLMGAEGLKRVGLTSHHNTMKLTKQLTQIEGVSLVFNAPYFHETVIRLNAPVKEVLKALSHEDIQAGYDLSELHPFLQNCLLVCSTEIHNEADHAKFCQRLSHYMKQFQNNEVLEHANF